MKILDDILGITALRDEISRLQDANLGLAAELQRIKGGKSNARNTNCTKKRDK
jgi:hypothetical protein